MRAGDVEFFEVISGEVRFDKVTMANNAKNCKYLLQGHLKLTCARVGIKSWWRHHWDKFPRGWKVDARDVCGWRRWSKISNCQRDRSNKLGRLLIFKCSIL